MSWLVVLLVLLIAVGSVLAMSEASMTRINRVRAIALRDEGRRNAVLLEHIAANPARHLNAVYLTVMLVQNGSAILAAFLAAQLFGSAWVAVASFVFTLVYFVVVEAMSKTFAVIRTDTVALATAPVVAFLTRALHLPSRLLIGVSNTLLPGKGLREGPFVSEEDIRSMADVGLEEGAIEEREHEMIHSIFEFGDTVVREVMVPRPDMVMVESHKPVRAAMDLSIEKGYSRIPVFDAEPDNIVGVVYAKDMFKLLTSHGNENVPVSALMRPVASEFFVPESKLVPDLLREMQRRKVHMAIVVDEHGVITGLATLEDLLEEIVGEISDEYDVEDPDFVSVGNGTYRVKARLSIGDLNEHLDEHLDAKVDEEEFETVGGILHKVLGKLPEEGESAEYEGLRFVAERVEGRRIATVVIERLPEPAQPEAE